MFYIYDSRKRTLQPYYKSCLIQEPNTGNVSTKIELTEREGRFIEIMSNRDMNSWASIVSYVYEKDTKRYSQNNLNAIKDSLLKKVDLNIVSKVGYGLVLQDRIYIK